MLQRYRAIFRAPGTAAFCAAAFVMRMPIAIYPIGIVLIISARDGRYGFAGVLSACYVFGGAVGMPALAVLVDRFGQRRLLLPATAVHVLGVLALAVLIRTDAPHWLLVVPTVVFGVTLLSVTSLVRARWTYVYDGRPELVTAMSFESVLDELIFVIGPLVATLIATHTVPVLVLYVAATLVVVGAVWLSLLRGSEPPVHPRDADEHAFALRSRGMLLLTVVTVCMGAVFASAEVAAVAFCGQHHHRGASGIALAAIAAGSATAGLYYGGRDRLDPVSTRFRRQVALFAVLPLLLLAVVNVPLLVVAGFLLGLGVAPALITAFALVQAIVAPQSLTEGLTWVTAGLSVGYGAGAATVGAIADAHGARTAFLVVVVAGAASGGFGALLHRRLNGRAAPAPQPQAVAAE